MYKKVLQNIKKSEGSNHPIHRKERHFIMSAENPKYIQHKKMSHDDLVSHLKKRGMNVEEADGFYDGPERSIIVHSPKHHESQYLKKLAHKLGQESIIESDGTNHEMLFLHGDNKGKHIKGRGTVFHSDKPENYYTTLSDGSHFTHNFNWDEMHDTHPLRQPHIKSNLIHFSNREGLEELHPDFAGSGIKGTDFRSGKGETPFLQYYLEGVEPEEHVVQNSKHKYTVPMNNMKIYDKGRDPDNIYGKLKEEAMGRQTNPGLVFEEDYLKGIKDAGYHGFFKTGNENSFQDNTVHLFHPTRPSAQHPVHPKDKETTSSKNFHEEDFKKSEMDSIWDLNEDDNFNKQMVKELLERRKNRQPKKRTLKYPMLNVISKGKINV